MDYSPASSSALLQGILLTQGLNPCLLCLLHRQVGSLQLTPPGKPQHTHTHTKKNIKKKLFLHVCRPGTSLGGPGGKKQWVYLSFFRVQHLKVTQCLSDEKRKHFCNPLLVKQTMRECCWIQFLQIMWVKVECLYRTKNSFYYRIWLLSEDKIEEY